MGFQHHHVFSSGNDKAGKDFAAKHFKPKTFYDDISKRDNETNESVDLNVTGFPCQAFSMAGYRQGLEDAKGGEQIKPHVINFIDRTRPYKFV